jgi:outer membrane protein assembly factor BamB
VHIGEKIGWLRGRVRAALAGRRRRVAAAAGAVTVVAATLVAAAINAGGPAAPDYPPHTMPVLDGQFRPPSPLPTADPDEAAPDRPPPTRQDPAWQLTLPDELDPTAVAVTSAGYVVLTRDDLLVGVDADGRRLWSIEQDRWDDVSVSGDVVLTGREADEDRWPQPQIITALDPATGQQRWQEREASFWTAYAGVVYMSVCYGGQDGELGECQLSARDPASNQLRWQVPAYAAAQVMGADTFQARRPPAYLVVESYPTGNASRTVSTIDPATGARLGAGFDGHIGYAAFPQVLVSVDNNDDNPADGCTSVLTGYDLGDGQRRWRHVVAVGKEADGVYCRSQPDPQPSTGRLAATRRDGRPAVIDADTGELEWTGPRQGHGLAATAELLLVFEPATGQSADAAGAGRLVLYERGKAEPRWAAPAPPGAVPEAASFHEQQLLTHWDGYGPVGYDLADGDWWFYLSGRDDEAYLNYGPDWIAVCRPGTCTAYPLP